MTNELYGNLDRALAWLTDIDSDNEPDSNRMGAARAEIKEAMGRIDALSQAPAAEAPQQDRIRNCANALDQLFRQRHTTSDVEAELRALLRDAAPSAAPAPVDGLIARLNAWANALDPEERLTVNECTYRDLFREAATALAERIPPRDPTDDMIAEVYAQGAAGDVTVAQIGAIWRAMYDAATAQTKEGA